MSGTYRAAYVALGANLDDPAAQIDVAFAALAALPETRLVARSRLYRTAAWGPVAQPDYVNAVAALATGLAPRDLLDALLAIEHALGRDRRGERYGPRRIDLDLLVHGDARIDEPGLTLPHPRLAERAFVLVPLAEIAPALDVPGLGPVDALLGALDAEQRSGVRAL